MYFRAGRLAAASFDEVERRRVGLNEKPVFSLVTWIFPEWRFGAACASPSLSTQAWRLGYDALLSALAEDTSHTPVSALKEGQRDPEQPVAVMPIPFSCPPFAGQGDLLTGHSLDEALMKDRRLPN